MTEMAHPAALLRAFLTVRFDLVRRERLDQVAVDAVQLADQPIRRVAVSGDDDHDGHLAANFC